MKSIEINNKLIEAYLAFFRNLHPDIRLELIARLSRSLQKSSEEESNDYLKLFGALKNEETAEELISRIRSSRHFERQIESF